MPLRKIIEAAKLLVSGEPLAGNLDQVNPECYTPSAVLTDDYKQDIARRMLGRELTAAELIEIESMSCQNHK